MPRSSITIKYSASQVLGDSEDDNDAATMLLLASYVRAPDDHGVWTLLFFLAVGVPGQICWGSELEAERSGRCPPSRSFKRSRIMSFGTL